MNLTEVIKRLQGNRSDYELALEYAKLKDGEIPKRRDKYLRSVQQMMANPDSAQYGNLKMLFTVLGVNIEAAILIACSQIPEFDG